MWGVSAPWGDVSSAYRSTGIPNITIYAGVAAPALVALKMFKGLLPLLGAAPIQRALKHLVEKKVKGGSSEDQKKSAVHLWGRVSDANGNARERALVLPDPYVYTAIAAMECVRRLLAGKAKPGAWTPSKAFGSDFLPEKSYLK